MAGTYAPSESGFRQTYKFRQATFFKGDWQSGRSNWEVDTQSNRSARAKGQVVLLGGKPFRKATSYSIWNKSLQVDSPFYRSGYQLNSWDGSRKDGWTRSDYETGYLCSNASPAIPSDLPSGDRERAIVECLNKIADQKANLGEGLATLGQTIRMLRNPCQSLLDGILSAKRDRSLKPYMYKSFRDMIKQGVDKTLANRYLEYVYGWAPLMSDIYGLVELAKKQSQGPLIVHAKSTFNTTKFKGQGQWTYLSDTMHRVASSNQERRVACSIWASVNPNYSGGRALNQLGLLNPVSLAWELVPWSFVIDWFVPIGPVLNALTAPAGLDFITGYVSNRVSSTDIFDYQTWSLGEMPFTAITQTSPCNPRVTHERYDREALGGWPQPRLYLQPDPFKGDHFLKALALGISNLKR